MDTESMLEVEDKLESMIKLEGNYFIMDSEQLVANPFQDMQQDAANEAQKKSTMTEKLTSVKNNVCENHFQMAKGRLDRQKTRRMKQLHDHSNRLRHEVKLLDLDRQRHGVEIKKRMMPERDFSYDDTQIANTEKRLGANIASFYLDKKLKYPTRIRSGSDINVTPTIRKARAHIREQQMQRSSVDSFGTESRLDRAATAKTSSSYQKKSSSLSRRRDSRSAPAYMRDSRYGTNKPNSSTTLPAIDQEGPRDAWAAKAGHQNVKFVFENPLKILASSEESANLFARSYPYYPGMVRAVNFGSDSSDDEYEELSPSEIIDLRAILFGEVNERAASAPHSMTQQQLAAIRKAQGPPPKLTTDMKQEEANYINSKINTFLEALAMSRMRNRRDSDEISDDFVTGDTLDSYQGAMYQSKSTATAMTTTGDGDIGPNTNKSTSTVDLFGNTKNPKDSPRFQSKAAMKSANNDNPANRDPFSSSKVNTNTKVNDSTPKNATRINNSNTNNTNAGEDVAVDKKDAESPRHTKYSWRCITGKSSQDSVRGNCSSEDLVLQALTGVPISNMLKGHVPLHSASRAMRHTATFKMHKIVEKLINERTKYQRHQVEELKRQMVTDEQQVSESRRTSNSSIGTRSSQVLAK